MVYPSYKPCPSKEKIKTLPFLRTNIALTNTWEVVGGWKHCLTAISPQNASRGLVPQQAMVRGWFWGVQWLIGRCLSMLIPT